MILAAQQTFRSDWGRRPYSGRAVVLKEAAARLRDAAEDYARLATLERGKLPHEAREEVTITADILDYYAEHAETLLAERAIPWGAGTATVQSLPLG